MQKKEYSARKFFTMKKLELSKSKRENESTLLREEIDDIDGHHSLYIIGIALFRSHLTGCN